MPHKAQDTHQLVVVVGGGGSVVLLLLMNVQHRNLNLRIVPRQLALEWTIHTSTILPG